MPDLMQFKRGPLANVNKAKLVLGEPAFLYDKKIFCIGTGEASEPVYFISEKETKSIVNALGDSLQQNIYENAAGIVGLNQRTEELSKQINALGDSTWINYESVIERIHSVDESLDKKIADNLSYVKKELDKKINVGKIKSSEFSTAYDTDKIGLVNLKQEVISYINNNGGGSGGGSDNTVATPNSIGFDLLSREVISAIQEHDFGTFANPLQNIDFELIQDTYLSNISIPNSIGFDLLSRDVVSMINNNNFGDY